MFYCRYFKRRRLIYNSLLMSEVLLLRVGGGTFKRALSSLMNTRSGTGATITFLLWHTFTMFENYH